MYSDGRCWCGRTGTYLTGLTWYCDDHKPPPAPAGKEEVTRDDFKAVIKEVQISIMTLNVNLKAKFDEAVKLLKDFPGHHSKEAWDNWMWMKDAFIASVSDIKATAPPPSSPGELVRWQPIETAPKDKPILIAVGKAVGSGCWRTAKHWDTTGHAIYADGCDMPSHATHWMPLPPAPDGGKDGAR